MMWLQNKITSLSAAVVHLSVVIYAKMFILFYACLCICWNDDVFQHLAVISHIATATPPVMTDLSTDPTWLNLMPPANNATASGQHIGSATSICLSTKH